MSEKSSLKVIKGESGRTCEIAANFILDTEREAIDKLNLGKRPQVCKLCGASGEFITWECAERLYGMNDIHNYFECLSC